MCGIAGYIDFNQKIINSIKINKIIDSLKHRGPDKSGYWISKNKNITNLNI